MKISIVSSLNESSIPETQVIEKFEDLCSFLSQLGYDGIELALLEPEKIPLKRIIEISNSYQMKIPALGTGATYIRFKYSIGSIEPSIRSNALHRLKKYIELASRINSKVIIGLIRGRYSYKSNLEIEKTNIVNSLKDCCKIAEDAGVILLLEPINRFEIDSCNTIKESIKLIEEVNSDYLKLMIDSFHMHLEEDPELIWTELDSYHSLIQHVHLADDTRRAPGTGHINFKRLIGVLEKNNYNEFYSFETIMKPSFEKIAKDSIKYLRSLKI